MHIQNKKINAFTFAELMISLVIIAVITVILYPTLSDLAPNNNKVLFKSTYKTIEMIISDIMVTSDIPNLTNANNSDNASACLCNEFADRMNVNMAVNAGCAAVLSACPSGGTYSSFGDAKNTFVTTNGVRWAFKYNANNTHEILVDVNASNNALDPAAGNITINASNNPPPTGWGANLNNIWSDVKNANAGYTARGINYTNNAITQDTFLIRIAATGNNRGKITVLSSAGNSHLLDRQ